MRQYNTTDAIVKTLPTRLTGPCSTVKYLEQLQKRFLNNLWEKSQVLFGD